MIEQEPILFGVVLDHSAAPRCDRWSYETHIRILLTTAQ